MIRTQPPKALAVPLFCVLAATAACSTDALPFSSAGESLGAPTAIFMKPTGGLGHTNTSTAGCPIDDQWECVTDGTSFAANDGDKTHVDSTAAGGRQGTSYSGAPAGEVTQVTANVVASAQSGASGSVTVALYAAGRLLATGVPHSVTGSYVSYADTFHVSVASANTLQAWVTFSSANLKYTEVWLDVALASRADAGADAAKPHSVTLTWHASTTPGVTYSVLRSTTSGSGYVPLATGLTALTWTDTSVQPGATYYYVVDDSQGSQTSADSNQATAVVP